MAHLVEKKSPKLIKVKKKVPHRVKNMINSG